MLTDTSGLVPGSQKWFDYWDRQVYLYLVGEAPPNQPLFPLDAFRAVLRNSDKPGSLTGTVYRDDEE